MKKLLFLVLALTVAVVVAGRPGGATTYATHTFKTVTVNFVVTPSPSPTPVAYVPTQEMGRRDPAEFASLLHGDDLASQVAFDPVALSDITLEQSNQGAVPVSYNMLADPNFQYLHIVQTDPNLNAGYGANTFTCAFSVFAHYTTSWEVSDYVYGSSARGGTAGINGYPTYNYPTVSLLKWEAEGITSTFKAYSNDGAPGEVTFTGAANSTKTVCIDLSLYIGPTIAAGTYQATIQYNLLTAL